MHSRNFTDECNISSNFDKQTYHRITHLFKNIKNKREIIMTYTHSFALSSCKQNNRYTFLFHHYLWLRALPHSITNTKSTKVLVRRTRNCSNYTSTSHAPRLTPAEQLILKNLGFFKESIFLLVYTVVNANEGRNSAESRKVAPNNIGKEEGETEREVEEGRKLLNWSVDISVSFFQKML